MKYAENQGPYPDQRHNFPNEERPLSPHWSRHSAKAVTTRPEEDSEHSQEHYGDASVLIRANILQTRAFQEVHLITGHHRLTNYATAN